MTNKLRTIIANQINQEYATVTGRNAHIKLQNIFFDDAGVGHGDTGYVAKISCVPELVEYMGPKSRSEVPIAGFVNGKFISRRIDRLYLDNDTKNIVVLDYKTDKDKNLYYEKYREQLIEYRELLKQIYRGFHISCKILWINDFTLENII